MSATVKQDLEAWARAAGADGVVNKIINKMDTPDEIAAHIRAVVSG